MGAIPHLSAKPSLTEIRAFIDAGPTVGEIEPYHLRVLQSALNRVKHARNSDKQAGAGELTLNQIFPAGGNEP